jgi:hypothetical protein
MPVCSFAKNGLGEAAAIALAEAVTQNGILQNI